MPQLEFTMPKMGESITEGTIINWLVPEGGSFEEGDILVEVATDKVDNEVPAPSSGMMVSHKVQAKEVVPIGAVIAVLDVSENGVVKKEGKVASPQGVSEKNKEKINLKPKTVNSPKTTSFKINENIFISPLVDSIAKKHHISYEELSRISGTGKEGRLRKSDVVNYVSEGRPFQFVQSVSEPNGFQIPDLKFDKGTGKIDGDGPYARNDCRPHGVQ